MPETDAKPRYRGPRKLADLVSGALNPVVAKRGFATADLIASWADIVGKRHAESTAPEKIIWPRRPDDEGDRGILVIRVDGPRAVLVQHELGPIVERVNAFFGYAAIGSARIVQAPVGARARHEAPRPAATLDGTQESTLATTLSAVEGDELKAALDRLGRAVLTRPIKES